MPGHQDAHSLDADGDRRPVDDPAVERPLLGEVEVVEHKLPRRDRRERTTKRTDKVTVQDERALWPKDLVADAGNGQKVECISNQ